MNRKRYRCRDPKCAAVHRDYFGGQCRRCGRAGMLREVKPGSVAEVIAAAVAGEATPQNSAQSKTQRQLFQ